MKLTYQEILDNIFNALPMYHKVGSSAYKEGLENIETLMALIGNPERSLRCIHVAGTNGKGSVSHLLASFYHEKGYKVGLYTSPHLIDFRERIKVNGEMIAESDIVAFFERYNSDFQQIEPSFFEMTTALAFYHFYQQKVDIAIIEVGLGGRLDATNIISPILSIITNISLDHTALLGDNKAAIAKEKAGIIKADTPVVVGKKEEATWSVFVEQARAMAAPLYSTERVKVVEQTAGRSVTTRCIDIYYDDTPLVSSITLPLAGDYQLENIATMTQAILLLEGGDLTIAQLLQRAIEKVLINTHLEGRWQIIAERPLTICDTGHNSGGFHYLTQQLELLPCKALHIVMGFVNDKDIESIVQLLPKRATYHICKASIARALDTATIYEKMQAHQLTCIESAASVYETYLHVRSTACDEDAIYIGGSTFVVADFLRGYYASIGRG